MNSGPRSADAVSGRGQPPGPSGLPLVGSTFAFLRNPFDFFARCHDEFGDIVRANVAGRTFYFVTHPDDVERILVHDAEQYVKGELIQETLGSTIGNGLLLGEGDFWRRQRELIQPAFHPERIESYADAMTERTRRYTDSWTEGEIRPICEEMQSLAIRILVETLFGADIDYDDARIESAIGSLTNKFGSSSLSAVLPDWVPTPTNYRYRRSLAYLDEVIEDLIAERRAGRTDGDNLLSMLVRAETDDGERMSDETLRHEVLTFLLEGYGTTALVLTYAMYAVARDESVEQSLLSELDAVLGDRVATMDDLDALDYTEKVVKEAMRLYPPIYTIYREPLDDVEIGGYSIPAGSTLSLPQCVVHTDQRYYDHPERFDPSRWSESFAEQLPDYAYFPFGGGPRHCIGMRFAMAEAQLVLATLFQRFRFDYVGDGPIEQSMELTAQPKGTVEMRIAERRDDVTD